MSTQSTSAPRSRPRARSSRSAQYVTIRVTGVLLTVLALGHFGLTHIVNDVADTDAAFVARRWSSALWIIWDGLLLGTVLLHAAAGLATVVRDHRSDPASRGRWIAAVVGLSVIMFVVGVTALTVSVLG